MNTTIQDIVNSQLDAIQPPAGDLAAITSRGRAIRRLRNTRWVAAGTAVVVAAGLTATQIGGTPTKGKHYPVLAAFDISQGLRAYADPDTNGLIHLGNKSYPAKGMPYLDTDAAATPYGVVFFDKDQKPRLLGEDGKVVRLGNGPSTPVKGFHPSSKFDAANPFVAWTENDGSSIQVVLYDLAKDSVVASRSVPCSGKSCNAVKVDGLDQGMTFVRTTDGTYLWHYQDDSWTKFGGPGLRIADVHGHTLLYSGDTPTMATDAWNYVEGAIDAQLTFDGKHILDWSPVLKSVDGGPALRLSVGSKDPLAWYAIDTDGSILMALASSTGSTTKPGLTSDMYDCDATTGQCSKIGVLKTESGDPMFIGNDM